MNKNWNANIKLYEFYKPLLSKKQQDYFEASYYDDLSISEIADLYDVSRTAVHDALVKAEKKLIDYENKLNLISKSNRRLKLYNDIQDNNEIKKILIELES